MAKTPHPAKAENTAISVHDNPGAPTVFFDGAPSYGINNGIAQVTVAMARHLMTDGIPTTEIVATGHLRCSITAAKELRDTLQTIIDAAEPAKSPSQIN